MVPLRMLGMLGTIVCALAQAATAEALCFMASLPPTWREEARNADFVAIGYVVQIRRLDTSEPTGETVIRVDRYVYRHPLFRERDLLTLDRLVPIAVDGPPQAYLLFGELHQGNIDIYRGEPITSPAAVKEYLAGALAIDEANVARRIAQCFEHLEAADSTIVSDSYIELNKVPEAELIRLSSRFDRKKVRQLLADPNLNSMRMRVLLRFLAGCGTEEDADKLQKLIDGVEGKASAGSVNEVNAAASALEPVFIAYAVLSPERGFAAIHRTIADPRREFVHRYAALRALRYLWDNLNNSIDRQTVVNAMALLLDQQDMCDLAMEVLRGWRRWELTGKIISYYGKKPFDFPIAKRAIIRYALSAPLDNALAAEFVRARWVEDPERVNEIAEMLKQQ